ncbi:hypothetical protein LTR40_005301, partial [Exophiala xenobiotica]
VWHLRTWLRSSAMVLCLRTHGKSSFTSVSSNLTIMPKCLMKCRLMNLFILTTRT